MAKPPVKKANSVSEFLETVAKTPAPRDGTPGRLLFALDATASREPTWDRACHLQSLMFEVTRDIGNLAIQLCYYCGFNGFYNSAWCRSADALHSEMSAVRCLGGYTQIHRILEHALNTHRATPITAVVFVGDALEEDADKLCHLAGQLGVFKVPLFMFHEGVDLQVERTFKQMALLSGGAYAPFDIDSASELRDLLSAVAVYAAGGARALDAISHNGAALKLTRQLKK